MNFPSLLSDHEQRAFSDFLNQLAQEDSSNHSNTDGSNNAGTADPSLTQQQQQQLQLQLQHHLHLRQLQQQHQQQQQAQSGATGVPRLPPPPSLLSPSMSLDPSAAQQLALAQQQRDWIQQISANPLLAPGGVINPHAMSQAMLQNPLLMAQANAISQAMVLAQQQQQLQLQMQQQQQQQQQHQHFQQHQHQQQQQQQLDSHHSMHHHPFAPPSNNNILPPFHMQQQQYPGQQHRLHSSQEPLSPSSESGPPGIQMQSTEPPTKRKSRATSAGGAPDKIVESSSSRSSSPFSPSTMNSQHTQADPEAMSTNGSNHISKQESDVENGFAPPPSKKSSRRKGSTAKSLSMDASSGLVVKSAHRSSRDGYDPLQGNPRRKGRGESISKNGASQQNKGNTPDLDVHKEKTEGMDGNDKESSPMPSAPPQDSPTPSQNSSSGQVQPKSGSKKPHHELLTEAEKKANHIASEQKRRQNIRVGFDSLVEIVPTLSDCHRSEAVILQKSVEYIHRLMNQKNELKSRVRDLQAHLGDPLEDMDSASDMEVEQDE